MLFDETSAEGEEKILVKCGLFLL